MSVGLLAVHQRVRCKAATSRTHTGQASYCPIMHVGLQKEDASALSLGKIAAIVGVGVVVALLLLLLLFSGDSGGQVDTADPLTRR